MSSLTRVRFGHNPDPTDTYHRQILFDVLYNDQEIPVMLEIRCKDRECCPPAPANHYNVHVVTLYGTQNGCSVGEYVTIQRRFGDAANLPLGALVAGGAVPNGTKPGA